MTNENECKILLTEDEYEIVKKHLSCIFNKKIEQVNFYFDTEDLELHKNNITLRIRYSDFKYEVTLKLKEKPIQQLNLRKAVEYTTELSNEDVKAILKLPNILVDLMPEESISILKRFIKNESKIILLGSLHTYREYYDYYDNELCLDKSSYLGVTDWEVELETENNDTIKLFIAEAKALGIFTDKKLNGKYSRFLSKYGELEGD